jgi:hypothetical protein
VAFWPWTLLLLLLEQVQEVVAAGEAAEVEIKV